MSRSRKMLAAVISLAALGGVAGLALAEPVSAGVPHVSLKIGKHAAGPFSEAGVRLNLAEGEKKRLFIRVRSIVEEVEDANLQDDSATGYPMKYFTNKGTNISDEVGDGGYPFNARLDKARKFEAKIKRTDQGDAQECVYILANDGFAQSNVVIAINQPVGDCPT